ncbi:MAG: 3-deoxy-D-manno-octulosonic acid transferase, partial [bacterium]
LLHGVSDGEVNALRDLIPIRAEHAHVLVSASTDPGLKRATDGVGPALVRRYPLDFSRSVARFLDAVQPDAVALCELELWPNFMHACQQRGIPVGVINGRLSQRSFKGYCRTKFLLRKTFARLTFAAVQDQAYADRFVHMGVPAAAVHITDTMKWDTAKLTDDVPESIPLAQALGIDRTRPLIVAGSTGPREEALLHEACPPGVQLLCAPRRPERFDEAAQALPGCSRRSRSTTPTTPGTPQHRFLLDTIGELRAAYALADIAVVGRSFGNLHGSDPIEPVALGRPTIIGPRYGDFTAVVNALKDAGGLQVIDAANLRTTLGQLLDQPDLRAQMAQRGRACIRAHQGATTKHAEMILATLRNRSQ